jgi:RNA polymerase sigma-70 factor, ECF subfamily
MTDVADQLYERVLVLRCQAGDEAAFAELVERYQPRLRYFLRGMLRDAQGAEDAAQDIWLAVFRAVPRLADLDAFRAWLYRIAPDRALRQLRQRRPPYHRLDAVDVVDGRAEEAHVTAEDVERIHAALDEVSDEHRATLVLRYVEDMTYEEIARVVGCQVGTVRSRLHYAKRALRAVLERMNVHD